MQHRQSQRLRNVCSICFCVRGLLLSTSAMASLCFCLQQLTSVTTDILQAPTARCFIVFQMVQFTGADLKQTTNRKQNSHGKCGSVVRRTVWRLKSQIPHDIFHSLHGGASADYFRAGLDLWCQEQALVGSA